ncbi:hypothetical protein [Bradyrhizobium sp. 150]|uniref:hypothetical protein n=1 Tax=Bradyrhizobium sp. 150 TaxID=2782625 RepID=UPI001FFA0761|nr:hypothetical protein [Bradyrhizobium sp. 150]MCK1674996.1 transposase [Bradyrhizobium sp. 150]
MDIGRYVAQKIGDGGATIVLDISKLLFTSMRLMTRSRSLSQRLRRVEIIAFSSLSSCLVGIEACASAHNWAREFQRLGYDVRLIPPAYVKLRPERS